MLQSIYERLRDSLFALPATLILALGAMAWLARRVDGWLPPDTPWLLPTTVDSSRAILSTAALATITVAGIVFSVTAVVVQLATSQLSPRVTQGFLRDPFHQVTIGVTIGTFVYSLLILSDVHGTEEIPFTRHDFSVSLDVLMAVISMILIVLFIDSTMRNLRIDTVIRWLADETEAAVESLPERQPPSNSENHGLPEGAGDSTVPIARTGWVTAIDVDRILAVLPPDTSVRLDLRVGDFVVRGEVAARTWPGVSDATQEDVARAIKAARNRSIDSDPAYGLRQMVDIALRSLSPAIKDPTTGSDVIRHLGQPLQALLLREMPGRVIDAEGGRRVYLPRAPTHSDYVHGTFREIRLAADKEPYVLHALVETLASLISVVEAAGHEGRAAALHAEAEETMAMIERSELPPDDKESLVAFARGVGLEEAAQ